VSIAPGKKGIEPMTRSTIQRIATVGLAAVAMTAFGRTASGAGDEATTCRTWHSRIIVSGRHQHTWNPDAVDDPDQRIWNPVEVDRQNQHTWNPDTVDGQNQHTWNPDVVDGQYQHTWNPAGDRSDACLSPSGTTP
jgi:hypothetical protein